MLENRHIIAKNTAKLIHDGDFINLGVGMPTLVGMYFPEDITVWLHAENGVLGQHKILGSCFRDDYDWLVEHIGSKGESLVFAVKFVLGGTHKEYDTAVFSEFAELGAFGIVSFFAGVFGAVSVDQHIGFGFGDDEIGT